MDKLKFLEFDVTAGHVLYVPSYWWYSIQYMEEDTISCVFNYHSAANALANLPNYGLHYIQQCNTHKKPAKVLDMSEIEVDTETSTETVEI